MIRRLVQTAQHSPHPVYGADLCGDLIAWNDAVTTYYTDFGRLPPDRRNMLRWLLESPDARERLPDWADDVPDVVARWRGSVTVHGG